MLAASGIAGLDLPGFADGADVERDTQVAIFGAIVIQRGYVMDVLACMAAALCSIGS